MDGIRGPISPIDLYARLGTEAAPILVDVRRATPDPAKDRLIVSAFHRPPQEVGQWSDVIDPSVEFISLQAETHNWPPARKEARRG